MGVPRKTDSLSMGDAVLSRQGPLVGNMLARVYEPSRERDARICWRSRLGRNTPRGALLPRYCFTLVWTLYIRPSFALEVTRDTGSLFPPRISAFRRPTRSGPKVCVDTLFGTLMRVIVLFVMTINRGPVRPDFLELVLLK